LQSALIDRQSLVISYDRTRGEPRGKVGREGPEARKEPLENGRRTASQGLPVPVLARASGDCIDCHLCVATCPTGIDIRNGIQLECVGCAQCIDACDAVMDKIGRPRGLIRYSSQARIEGTSRRLLRPRLVFYPILLGVLLTAFVVILGGKQAADVTLLRGLGLPYTLQPAHTVSNALRLKITNRTDQQSRFDVEALDADVELQFEAQPIVLKAREARTVPILIKAPQAAFRDGAYMIRLRISGEHGFSSVVSYRLLGPRGEARAGDTLEPPSEGQP
jgi:cytochrome c oxidase accessory protein FixG